MMRNIDVAARKCAKCHRVFSKVEHLRRHQRSRECLIWTHSARRLAENFSFWKIRGNGLSNASPAGERTLEGAHVILIATRLYPDAIAHSDVLNRHIRNHHLLPLQDGERAVVPQSEATMDELLDKASPQLDADSGEGDTGSGNLPSSRSSSPQRNTPPGCPTAQDLGVHDPVNDNWNGMHLDNDIRELQLPCTEGLLGSLEDIRAVGVADNQHPPQLATTQNPEDGFTPFDPHMDAPLGTQPSITSGTFDIIPHLDFGSVLLDDMLLTPPSSRDNMLHRHQKDNISNEQFEQVRRLWPTRRRKVTLSPSLVCWDDILLHPEDNIFSSTKLKSIANAEASPATGSPWGLTEACRHRLAQSIISYAPWGANQTNGLDSHGSLNGELPPTDILDLCLDLYFGRFHIHLPFVHPGTFNACDTPSILLFPMCLVGMMILNRGAAHKLIVNYLPVSCYYRSL